MNRFRLAIQRVNSAAMPANPFLFIPSLHRFFQSILLPIIILFSIVAQAQTSEEQKLAEYKKTIRERSLKIVATLDITDTNKQEQVTQLLCEQYFSLNDIHEQAKKDVADIKTKGLVKEESDAQIKAREEKKSAGLLQRHNVFITQLKKELNDEQVDKVKDGMTYRVFPITWAAYQDMLPNLTKEQKDQLYVWLKEARELAMDEGSSDKKHAVFGKYKGKINNYLSAAGYDMKKEGEAWQQRIKEREKKSVPSN
jgi:hypothetical protein